MARSIIVSETWETVSFRKIKLLTIDTETEEIYSSRELLSEALEVLDSGPIEDYTLEKFMLKYPTFTIQQK